MGRNYNFNSSHHKEVYLAASEVLGSSYSRKIKLSELSCHKTARDVT